MHLKFFARLKPVLMAAALPLALGGCLVSGHPLVPDSEASQPFGPSTVMEGRVVNPKTGQVESVGQITLRREKAGYRVVNTPAKGDMAMFKDNVLLLKQIKALDIGALYVVQMQLSDSAQTPVWGYGLLAIQGKTPQVGHNVLVMDYRNINSCDALPADWRAQLPGAKSNQAGCGLAELGGLPGLMAKNFDDRAVPSNGYSFTILSQ